MASVSLGFLSHHRSGIVYPQWVELYTGPDPDHLRLHSRITLPCAPAAREIAKEDVTFQVDVYKRQEPFSPGKKQR